jgi:ankyrin repeat protein
MDLLKAGAKIARLNKWGWAPLDVAVANDNILAAEVLIKEGARIMQRTNDGKTPLDLAESAAMIRLLKDNGAVEQ